jgi:hypothetical protein
MLCAEIWIPDLADILRAYVAAGAISLAISPNALAFSWFER